MPIVIVTPIARPAILLERAAGVGRAREDHPDEEEGQRRLDGDALALVEHRTSASGAPYGEVARRQHHFSSSTASAAAPNCTIQ